MTVVVTKVDQSNSLADLAHRIRGYHEATVAALKSSVEYAMAAGDLLVEAKAQLKHGQWLPWLKKNCPALSERTVQLYIKLAKNRAVVEKEMKSASIADLTLNEAAALCVLAGRIHRLIEFAKRAEAGDPEDLINLTIAEGFGVIRTPYYDPFAHCDAADRHDWQAFTLFLVRQCHWHLTDSATYHIQYLLQKQFKNPAEWLGEEGRKFRRSWGGRDREPSPKFLADWEAFALAQASKTTEELEAELDAIAKTEGVS